MSSSQALVQQLKAELKAAGLTYATLARELGLAESSIKRMFARSEMTLARVDAVCRVLRLDFAELARRVADAQPLRLELTLEQERAVVADRKLLLLAICCLSQWSLAQMLASYRLGEAEAVALLARLDHLDIIELRPGNRYRLKVAKTLRWRPQGPVMQFFREQVLGEYYGGGFDGEGELLMLVHGEIAPGAAARLSERLQRLAEDFAAQHRADQQLPDAHKRPFTLVLAQRSWLFTAFRELQRR